MESKQTRAHSLDALRGYAIMTMILSATEAFSILPAWMYHAQVPPPNHVFTPTIYGITWVDLIFPFFLFSMGAAFPLSLGRQYAKGVSKGRLCYKSILRWFKLVYFAIFIQHCFPYLLGYSDAKVGCLVAIGAFGLMCLMFMKNPFHISERWAVSVNAAAYIIGALWIFYQPYQGAKVFSVYDSDCIILILSNVAVVGSIIYLLTMHNIMARLAVIPFILAIFLSAGTQGSWAQTLTEFSSINWMFQIPYLRYLLIIIPGTIAGDLLNQWLQKKENEQTDEVRKKQRAPFIMIISLLIIITNVCCLYNRWLVANLIITIVLLAALHFMLKAEDGDMKFWKKLYTYGAYFLMLGICFEAFQGGIRKDDVTFSYLILTAGLAFIAMIFLSIVCDYYHCKVVSLPLEQVGKSPMVAYVSDSLMVLPLLEITGVYDWMSSFMDHEPWLGFLKGVIITALCMLFTSLFTWKKWFWKT